MNTLELQQQHPYAVSGRSTHPQHIFNAACRAGLSLVDAEDCANGHSTVDVGGAIKRIHDYTILAPVCFFNDHWVVILLADLEVAH